MNFRITTIIAGVFVSLSGITASYANEVVLSANQPMEVTYKVVHKNQDNQSVLGELQTLNVNKAATISVSLDAYDQAGVIIVSVGGHKLPSVTNQFDKPKQCAMATDKIKTTGTLNFTLSKHSINCSASGGIFG